MFTFIKSDTFEEWLQGLKDLGARERILECLDYAEGGNLGDCGLVGGGVSEMRLHFGPGYRLYFTQRGIGACWLLCGGTKKTQRNDIEKAKGIKGEMEKGGGW